MTAPLLSNTCCRIASAASFSTDAVNRLIKRIGERAGFPFKVHVHMPRHACGYALANAGHDTRAIQDWLGHRAIQHTARYTE
jgi:site-specific recombinase XerD